MKLISREELNSLKNSYLESVLSGEKNRALRLIERCLDHQLPMSAIYLSILAPAQAEIGRHWSEGKANVAQEHLASQLGPLLAAMPVLAGTGKVSFASGSCGFELSQRAQYMATLIGSRTTDSRSMITLKEEALGDGGVRLHIIDELL